uniref:alpha/beta fold hydrolase n=1 Tax=Acetatifactor sp. TaxID=1872090 RepID=UPI004056E081
MTTDKKKHILLMVLKWIIRILLVVILLVIAFILIARTATYFSNHITTEQGVDEGIYVELGGQEQYLLIRGEDCNNPVIIWLHGGPSSPDGFVNYVFTKYLVNDYTVICWDQRGCGRTYFRNADSAPENQTFSFEQALLDLDDLITYACERFDIEKVILVGHSYGTMLGSKYTLEHPDKVDAFIGVGQVVSIESDIYSYQDALSQAQRNGDDTAAMEAAYQTYIADKSLLNMMSLRNYVMPYHTAPKAANTIWDGVVSPYMGFDDLRWFLKQLGDFEAYTELNRQLFDHILTADVRDYGLQYHVPVGFISGSCDWTTPVKYAEDYYNLVSAPAKDFYQLEGCGHSPQYDAPEEFCTALKEMLSSISSKSEIMGELTVETTLESEKTITLETQAFEWPEITDDGVDEELFLNNLDTEVLETISGELQALVQEPYDTDWLSLFDSENYQNVLSMGESAMKPLYWIIYKSTDAGLYEYICATALSELSGYDFATENGVLSWSNSKEFLERFNEKILEERHLNY